MKFWGIVNDISLIVGILTGIVGVIISFVTMKKATGIERYVQKEKADRGFRQDYDGLLKNLNIYYNQMSLKDIDNPILYPNVMKSLYKIAEYAGAGGNGGEWSKKDISSIKKCVGLYEKEGKINESNSEHLTLELVRIISLLEMKGNAYDIR